MTKTTAEAPDAPKKRTGRPRKYTPELAREVCRLIAEGKSFAAIGAMPGMPGRRTMLEWTYPDSITFESRFLPMLARAREEWAARLFAEALAIADDPTGDVVERINPRTGKPYETTDYENIQRSRLRVDTRRWAAARLDPKRFGEKTINEISGADGGPIKTESLVVEVTAQLDVLRARMRQVIAPKTVEEAGQNVLPLKPAA